MTSKLAGTAALVTGASSGIGAATARQLAALGASVALVARRRDRLEALAVEIENAGGTALAIEADITDCAQAQAAVDRTADIVNISSIAGRVAWNGYGVYNLTKFGVNGFTESLRQEITQRHVRVGVLEPGGVDTELGSHNTPEVRGELIDPFYEQTKVLAPEDVADAVAYMVTRPRHASIAELWIMPTDQA
ncbi:SDR family NAD(P)-dependent oxidoreductase [Pseudarthrobacter sp. P1]|uniref:SDR family NAD(P)-dependent oxidoreductase n=1 Tax=Pseudarthrobacter sp. P1 TaxID=3418418 RepID=UPI003CF2B52A